ncbi:universal stress protein [Polaribacter pectinis]|uniref:Universal stress protein n=1 Tax=Polaribacter pectinis TaxID=2738844 RepID=A0A7G9L8A5_9FLAO|nr:universal stress protein [Polaribacter pectinis]QNM84854.1 universal stress protein [Polaribacter pectinis]
MKHILVPIGSTVSAQNTLQYAIDFASEIDAKVFVFRAYNAKTKAGTMVNVNSIIGRETNLYLRTLVSSVNVKNVDIKLIASQGSLIDSVEAVHNEIGVDLIIVGTKSNSIKEELFLGNTAGKLAKMSDLSVLVIPEAYTFKPVTNILVAFKSGIIKRKNALKPLQFIANKFTSSVNLLLVKTPNYTEEDLVLNEGLKNLQSTLTVTENATTFQAVLEHSKTHNPDLLCVFRRKRGFFKKLWEKSTILKEEFSTTVPLLILKGK